MVSGNRDATRRGFASTFNVYGIVSKVRTAPAHQSGSKKKAFSSAVIFLRFALVNAHSHFLLPRVTRLCIIRAPHTEI
jgi:hypothetical protein